MEVACFVSKILASFSKQNNREKSIVTVLPHCIGPTKPLQSRPIKMRTPILYLANRWTKFKMLLTSNRFLYLIRFLLLSFPLIPQFIAQFRSICLFLCSSPYFLPVATKWELEQSMHCPLCHCCHSFLFSPSERTKWWSKKVLKSLS